MLLRRTEAEGSGRRHDRSPKVHLGTREAMRELFPLLPAVDTSLHPFEAFDFSRSPERPQPGIDMVIGLFRHQAEHHVDGQGAVLI